MNQVIPEFFCLVEPGGVSFDAHLGVAKLYRSYCTRVPYSSYCTGSYTAYSTVCRALATVATGTVL